MKRRRLMVTVGVVVALGVAGWALWLSQSRPARAAAKPGAQEQLVVTASARRADLALAITQTGTIAAKNSTPVIPDISGRIQWVCTNGIVVSAGDTIVRLDPTALQDAATDLAVRYRDAERRQAQSGLTGRSRMQEMALRLKRAQADVTAFERQQQAELRQLRDEIAFNEADLKRLAEDVETKKRLAAKGLVAGTEVERAEAALKAAQFSVRRAKSDYDLKESKAKSDIAERRANVFNSTRDMTRTRSWTDREMRMTFNEAETLKLQLDRANADLLKTVITAPTRGLVVLASQGGWMGESRLPKMGDFVSQGREVASIVSLDKMQVKLELDQTEIAGVKMGQTAQVEIEALPGKVLKGKITAIGQTARRPPVQGMMGLSQSATFPVTIDLPPTGTALIRPGMRASARIVYHTVKNAILVPAGCIFKRDGASIVFAQRGGKFVRTVVKEGESNGDYTAIVSGLKAGDRIALNDLGAPATEGQDKAKETRR